MAKEVRSNASRDKLKLIGDRLKVARKAKALTQERAGAEVGVSGMTVRRHEKGLTEPSAAHIAEYSLAYGVSVADLLAGVADEEEIDPVKVARWELLDLDIGPTVDDFSPGLQALFRTLGQLPPERRDEVVANIVASYTNVSSPLRGQAAQVASILKNYQQSEKHRLAVSLSRIPKSH